MLKKYGTKTVLFIPVLDKNGFPKNKWLRVIEGGEIYKKLIGTATKLPEYVIEN